MKVGVFRAFLLAKATQLPLTAIILLVYLQSFRKVHVFLCLFFHWYLRKYFVYASLEVISFSTPALKWINFIKEKQ